MIDRMYILNEIEAKTIEDINYLKNQIKFLKRDPFDYSDSEYYDKRDALETDIEYYENLLNEIQDEIKELLMKNP